jgi:hypothetical protein
MALSPGPTAKQRPKEVQRRSFLSEVLGEICAAQLGCLA